MLKTDAQSFHSRLSPKNEDPIMSTARLFIGRLLVVSSVALLSATLANPAHADPIASYTVSGSANNYTLDLTIDNTTSLSIFDIGWYFNTSLDPIPGPSAAPSGFELNGQNWQDIDFETFQEAGHLPSGATLSGFFAEDQQDLTAPTSLELTLFFADNLLDEETGNGSQVTVVAMEAPVPDSGSTVTLLAIGLSVAWGLALRGRRIDGPRLRALPIK
jgi:hypothetical protein